MLNSILSSAVAEISVTNAIICIVSAIVLGVIISLVHKFTTKTTSNFLITLGILPLLISVVIFLINGNLGTSLAVAGAFSLIRFRSMPGNSKEILSVFWAMAIGLAVGMGYIFYAGLITIVVAIFAIIYSKIMNNKNEKNNRKLKIVIPENLDYEDVFSDLLEKYTNKYEIQKVKTTNMGSMYEINYLVNLKNDINVKKFMDEIRIRNGNMLVMLERAEVSEVDL